MDRPLRENQALWDAWTRIHVPSAFYDVASFRDGTNPIRLSDYEREEVGPVDGRTLLHLQCHFGLDTLSWARLGATVTGLDFSAEAVAAARALAADLGIEARFVQSNLYDAPAALDGTFDVVYTSRGVLGWLPDIEAWAHVAAGFVRPGGIFYVTEIHPVAQVLADEDVAPGELRLAYPYWSHAEPVTFEVHGSYADPAAATDGLVEHGWDHSLGEIVTALVNAGLRIDFLHEQPFVEWPLPFLVAGDDGRYRLPADTGGELPLFFSLRATKPPADAPDAPDVAAIQADAATVRRRAADELHDAAGQSLVAAFRFLDAATARGVAAGGGTDPDLEAAHGQVLAAMRELRAVVDTLAPPGLEERGLGAAIREWAERQGRAGVEIEVRGELPPGDDALELGWFDLVTAAARLPRGAGTDGPLVIELHAAGDRRIITVAGVERGPGLAALRDDDDATRTLAWMGRVAARLAGSVRIDRDGTAAARIVIEGPAATAGGPEVETKAQGEP